METQQLFVLITPQNTLKKIPKADSEFNFVLPPRLFTLHGMHFLYRTSERAARK
jgi:ribonuclease P protein subunit POP4